MLIKNYLEDIVSSVLEELLKSRTNICKCEKCRLDMTAYSLNKLPPKYVVSERGLLHSEIDALKDVQLTADIIATVNEAIDKVSSKLRPGYFHNEEESRNNIIIEEETKNFYFNFPHIIGSVLTDQNEGLDFWDNIKVFLYNTETNELVKMAENSWHNPYTTNKATMGFYSFWPAPIQSNNNFEEERNFKFKITAFKEGFTKKEIEFDLQIKSIKKIYNYVQQNNIKRIKALILNTEN